VDRALADELQRARSSRRRDAPAPDEHRHAGRLPAHRLSATFLIVLGVGPTAVLWWILGFVFSIGNLAYALLQRHFPGALAGRVNTALNLLVFLGAFSIQWGFGALLDVLQGRGMALRSAFQATFAILLAMQVASWLWYSRRGARPLP
jgi:hypothetical protein